MHKYPALHNAMWPGLVGKGPDSEPPIALDTMLDLTAASRGRRREVRRRRSVPLRSAHDIDASDDDLSGSPTARPPRAGRRLAGRAGVAADRRRIRDGRRRGSEEIPDAGREGLRDRPHAARSRHPQIRRHPHRLRRQPGRLGRRIPAGNTKRIAETFRQAADIAEAHGERLAAEGEICWGGMHSWKQWSSCSKRSAGPKTVGMQTDMAHTLLFLARATTPRRIACCRPTTTGPTRRSWTTPQDDDRTRCGRGRSTSTSRRTTRTVKGSGSHDKTGRHCLPLDPNGKLDIVKHAGFWLRDDNGQPTRAVEHICWDGCMFPNAVMTQAADLEATCCAS